MDKSIFYTVGAFLLLLFVGGYIVKLRIRKVFNRFGFDKNAMSQWSEKASHLYKTEPLPGSTTNATNGQTQIESEDFKKEAPKDTTNWERFLVYIHGWRIPVEVINNGTAEGYLIDFEVKPAGVYLGNSFNPLAGLNVIRNCYIPKSHLQSFGKYTQLLIRYDPQNPLEISVDPEYETWHYEIKS